MNTGFIIGGSILGILIILIIALIIQGNKQAGKPKEFRKLSFKKQLKLVGA